MRHLAGKKVVGNRSCEGKVGTKTSHGASSARTKAKSDAQGQEPIGKCEVSGHRGLKGAHPKTHE